MRFDTLVRDQVLRGERKRPRDQQHQRHSQEMRPEFREQLVRRGSP